MIYRIGAALLAGVLALPAGVPAQSLRQQCVDKVQDAAYRLLCSNLADATQIVPPRFGIVASGGNPVPGTASTLGMRLGARPRMSVTARFSAVEVELPGIQDVTWNGREFNFFALSVAADASVGLFQGFALLPTVGGFGSIDLLGSIGIAPLRDGFGDGFHDTSQLTWAAGARIGILRESFNAPGVSLSAMYRSFGTLEYGDVMLGSTASDFGNDAYFRMRDFRATSFRGVVGKRLVSLGFAGGVGYDRYHTDVLIRVCDPSAFTICNTIEEISDEELKTSRVSLFANASYTFLLATIVGELGWQTGGDLEPGASETAEKGAGFLGIAVRIGL
jgi:hypothetical protein